MPKVTIIILTYNSAGFIKKLLESIKRQHKDLSGLEIIIVDNDSNDKTIEEVLNAKLQTSDFKLIRNKENVGFAKGINIGAEKATGDFLLFINPDTEFEKGDIWKMTEVFAIHKEVGIVGGKLLKNNGKVEKSAGNFFGFFETIIMAFGLDEVFGVRTSPEKLTKVGFVSGGFLMIKKDLFEKLGGFDENFFMYIEDMDLCKRAKEEGFSTYFTPDVVLVHASHGSSNRSFAIENIYKSIIYYHEKHSNSIVYFLVKMILKLKAFVLVIIGRIINNKYLVNSYSKALSV